jgi:SET domain-containing protein
VARCAETTALFPALDGTALYSLVCMMNHSCRPGCEATYPEDGRGAVVARVTALRDLGAGEELCMAYVLEADPLEERREQLRHYGFECTCEKCREEHLSDPSGHRQS